MENDNIVYVGRKNTMVYVMAVMMQMNQGNTEVTIKARGKSISRACDVSEITKNKFMNQIKTDKIKIYTEEIQTENNEPLKISSIEILMKKIE